MEENKLPAKEEIRVFETPDPPPSPASNPIKKTGKYSIKAIISTIIFLLLAGGAAAGFVYREQIRTIVIQPTPAPSPTIMPTPILDFTGWYTYETNENLDIHSSILREFPNFKKTKLSFQHPSWLEIEKKDLQSQLVDYPNPIANIGFELKNEEYRNSHGGPSDYSVGMSFLYAKVPKGLKNFDNEFWGVFGEEQRGKTEDKIINDTKAIYGYDNYAEFASPKNLVPARVIFHISETEQVLVLINFWTFDNDCATQRCKDIIKDLNQMLTSFKFTDPSLTPSPTVNTKCVVAGCSGQLCVEEGSDNGISTCEYKEEYACYKSATCEQQSDGNCGWTQTTELKTCIESAN